MVLDRKIATHLQVDILRNKLALQREINKADKTRDTLKKLEADLRSNMMDKDDHSADITADRKTISTLKTDLKKSLKSIASMRSEIKKDVAERVAIVKDIAKNEKGYKTDVAALKKAVSSSKSPTTPSSTDSDVASSSTSGSSKTTSSTGSTSTKSSSAPTTTASSGTSSTSVASDLAKDKKSIHLLVAQIDKDRQMLRTDRNKTWESLESSEDTASKPSSSLKSTIKNLRTKLSSAVKSLRVARMDLRKDEAHHVSTASALHASATSSSAKTGSRSIVRPVVHPVDKK